MPVPARVTRVLRGPTPLRWWKTVVLLALVAAGLATGQVVGPALLVGAIVAHAVIARLTTDRSEEDGFPTNDGGTGWKEQS